MNNFNEAFEAALAAVNELAAHPGASEKERLWALNQIRKKAQQREREIRSSVVELDPQ